MFSGDEPVVSILEVDMEPSFGVDALRRAHEAAEQETSCTGRR
jgi:hypothetical protein